MRTTKEGWKIFGDGSIKLTPQNIVIIDLKNIPKGKALPFWTFKENIYYYSELMTSECVALLSMIETQALVNAQKDGKAKENMES